MPKSLARKSETKSNKKQTKSNKKSDSPKEKATKPKQNEKNEKKKRPDEKTYSYFREYKATELILAGIPCIDSFHSRTLDVDLYKFEDSKELTEALRQIAIKKGQINQKLK